MNRFWYNGITSGISFFTWSFWIFIITYNKSMKYFHIVFQYMVVDIYNHKWMVLVNKYLDWDMVEKYNHLLDVSCYVKKIFNFMIQLTGAKLLTSISFVWRWTNTGHSCPVRRQNTCTTIKTIWRIAWCLIEKING